MKNSSKTPTVPSLPNNLSKSAKWLPGEGAGSWFEFIKEPLENTYKISRFSANGNLECVSHFNTKASFNIQIEYTITYPSHCTRVSVLQDQEIYEFIKL